MRPCGVEPSVESLLIGIGHGELISTGATTGAIAILVSIWWAYRFMARKTEVVLLFFVLSGDTLIVLLEKLLQYS